MLFIFYTFFQSTNLPVSKIFWTIEIFSNSKKLKKSSKIEVVSISSMMAEAIKRISNSTSVSSLFK